MPTRKQPKVGVVILTYNAEKFIAKCLKNILQNDYKNFSCVAVDNKSQDNTTSVIIKRFPKVHLIKSGKNDGFAAGNNRGIRYFLKKERPEYLLILNPDTEPNKNLISELITFMEKTPTTGVIGPIITYSANPNKIWFAGGIFNKIFCYTKHKNMNKSIEEVSQKNEKADFITGACMMIRTDILEKTGLLPEKYFMYFEDVDFCQQVYRNNYNCYLLAKPLVKHAVSASAGKIGSNDLTPFRAYYFARNPFIYIKTNVKGLIRIANYIGQFFIAFPYYILQILLKHNILAFTAYIRGLISGIFY